MKRLVILMRKALFVLLTVLMVALCAPALAETMQFDVIHATCEVSDDYIILTPDNLDQHPEWVANQGVTKQEMLIEWAERGVLMQAWTRDSSACLEITAVKDELAEQYFDIDQQSTKVRSSYRTQHLKGAQFKSEGYDYQKAEWKKTTQYGRFLELKYKREIGGDVVRGYARRTIRNGYTITLDYQVYGRSLKSADNSALNKVIGTWKFTTVLAKPSDAVAKVEITELPPMETSTGKFSVEGTCDPGLQITAVLLRMSSTTPILLDTTASAKGKFSFDVKLPQEGVWMMSLTVANGDTVTEEMVFDVITYQKTLLPINFADDMPIDFNSTEICQLPSGRLVISGTTLRNTKVQCLINGGVYQKNVTTNASGKFSFNVDIEEEGDYELVMVFQKKNYATRRLTAQVNRTFTEEDVRLQAKEEAVKPAYTTLNKKITGYTGRTMVYNLHLISAEQTESGWQLKMAMRKLKSGYRDVVYVLCDEDPGFANDTQHRMYGVCKGEMEVDGKDYPYFELLFWDD